MGNLDKIFDSVSGRNLFKNKQILQSNHTPEDIPHRENEIEHIASILAPCLLGQKTSNLFIYEEQELEKHYLFSMLQMN